MLVIESKIDEAVKRPQSTSIKSKLRVLFQIEALTSLTESPKVWTLARAFQMIQMIDVGFYKLAWGRRQLKVRDNP